MQQFVGAEANDVLLLFRFISQGTDDEKKRYQQVQSYYTRLKDLEAAHPEQVRLRVALAHQYQGSPEKFVDPDAGAILSEPPTPPVTRSTSSSIAGNDNLYYNPTEPRSVSFALPNNTTTGLSFSSPPPKTPRVSAIDETTNDTMSASVADLGKSLSSVLALAGTGIKHSNHFVILLSPRNVVSGCQGNCL